MALVFVLGVIIAAAAPLLRSYNRGAATALSAGAGILIAISLFDIIHPDIRSGRAAVESNWRFDRVILGCEVPVLALALISLGHWRKRTFWAGWSIHLAFTLWLSSIFVWLKFFWHW
jgi:hypothetical protein